VATGIFGFMSYVRNVKPEARLIYYLVRRCAARVVSPDIARRLRSCSIFIFFCAALALLSSR
jgi:hypothetical protein